MDANIQTYFRGIEERIIEEMSYATKSIKIAMAWFTSFHIKDSLIDLKMNKPDVKIEIVVDDNEINKNYFFDYIDKYEKHEIIIKENVIKKFLHHKFMIIDDYKTILGTYNYTKKACRNQEYICVCKSKELSSYFSRLFYYITMKDYIDHSVKLLFEFPEFARELLSTYYSFTKREYNSYKGKILLGYCFTFNNGLIDQIKYGPGLIFNSKANHYLKTEIDSEFSLPVKISVIKNWINERNKELIIDSYCEAGSFDMINNQISNNKEQIENYFKGMFDSIYSYEDLKIMIQNNTNIIIEDKIWSKNFEPFLNKKIIKDIFNYLPSYKPNRFSNIESINLPF